jgi:pimeloyl-ACP methyl ester carboxylesterase
MAVSCQLWLTTLVEQPAGLDAETLWLGGERSPAYRKTVLTGLEVVLPHARRVTLTGAGHLAAGDRGKPELVAAELRKFFR